ncbi:MAG: hypothetical protein ACRDRL_05580, partial [Sciscionella sp.]
MTRWILAIGVASLLAACATSPEQPATAQSGASAKTAQVASNAEPEKKTDKICTSSMEIGSHIPQHTCVTREQSEQRKKAAQQAMQNMTSGPRPGNCS